MFSPVQKLEMDRFRHRFQRSSRLIARLAFAVVLAGSVALPLLAQVPSGAPGSAQPQVVSPAKPVSEVPRAPSMADVDPRTYRMGALDEIEVLVYGEPGFSGAHRIRPDGKITLPFVGEVVIAGMTPDEAGIDLATRLKQFLTTPQVTVRMLIIGSRRYYLVGKFMKTGEIPLGRAITVMEAIASVGGFQTFANQSKVIILREGKQIRFNYKEVLKGKKMEQNILVENNDYIIAK